MNFTRMFDSIDDVTFFSLVSTPSTLSTQNEVAFSVTGYRGDTTKNSPVQRVRVTKRLITGTPTSHVREGSNLSQDAEETDIVVVRISLNTFTL